MLLKKALKFQLVRDCSLLFCCYILALVFLHETFFLKIGELFAKTSLSETTLLFDCLK